MLFIGSSVGGGETTRGTEECEGVSRTDDREGVMPSLRELSDSGDFKAPDPDADLGLEPCRETEAAGSGICRRPGSFSVGIFSLEVSSSSSSLGGRVNSYDEC